MRSPAWRLAFLASLYIAFEGCGHAKAVGAAAAAPPAPPAEIDVTLFLIGDAGGPAAPLDSEPVLLALRAAAAAVLVGYIWVIISATLTPFHFQ